MENMKETKAAYSGRDEKVIVERDRMGLVQALGILHGLRDGFQSCSEVYEAFQVVFEWIDNMILLLNKFGGSDESRENKIK